VRPIKAPGAGLRTVREKYAAAPVTRTPSSTWKIPAVILILAAIVVAGTLWSRRSHKTETQTETQATARVPDASTSAKPEVPAADPAPSNQAPTPAPSNAVSSATDPAHEGDSAESSAAKPNAAAANDARPKRAATHAASATPAAPAPFRVAIRASENCQISVTADGELVSRENLIAPASTSVKASHEIVVRVSNAAGISFRWNDRSIPVPEVDAGKKTFVFDNAGLRNTP
jgi:cytoskeletal protein RodZ